MAQELRGLLDSEKDMLRPAFGMRIDYSSVRLSNGHRKHPIALVALKVPNTDAITLGDTIYFGGHYHADFSTAPIESKCLLFHEMTHVWQWTALGRIGFLARYLGEFVGAGLNSPKMYKYKKANESGGPEHFWKARLEAQADMIRDYARAHITDDAAGKQKQAVHLAKTHFFDL
ncbi:MAG TPA: DUF4157 domain-containing protein [Allosphingosinicella sp.]|nr:DUF4157 domain-containing protein [Allosphingosinicella sp.]